MNLEKRLEIQQKLTRFILDIKDLILLVSIRLGKTKVALDAIETNETVLVIYPLATIKDNWEADIKKFPPKSDKIVFTTSHSLSKYKDSYFDYLIIDEIQLLSPKQRAILKTIKYKKRVALTGTLKKSTQLKLATELNLTVKAKYTLEEAINDKLVKDYRLYIHHIDLDNTIRNVTFSKFGTEVLGTEKQAYDHYYKVYEKGFKNQIADFIYNSKSLLKLAQTLVSKNFAQKLLIYSMRSEIVEKLAIGTVYTSKNRDKTVLEEFKVSKRGTLGVVNCIQAGITIEHLNKVIIHSAESNTEKFQQKLGRSLLYDFDGNYSEIHVCCLKDTIQERWINLALQSLNRNKVIYCYKNIEYNYINWIKFNNPNKELYLYNNSVCYYSSTDTNGIKYYKFIDSDYKEYSLQFEKLTKI